MKKTERAILTVFVIGLLLVVLRALVPAEVVVEPVIDNTAFREEIVDEVVEVERPAVLIPQEVTIEIIGFDFVPSDIIISPGTTVTWKN